MQPKQFRIPSTATSHLIKKTLFILVPVILLASCVGLFIGHSGADKGQGDYTALFISIPITLVALSYGIFNGIQRAKQQWSSYVLTFHSNSVQREQANTPTISLYHSEIKEIVRMHDGSFYIRAKDSADSILIPASIEQYDEVRGLLEGIMPISSKGTYSLLSKYSVVLTVVSMILMGIVFYSTNKYIVSIGGALLLGFLGWALYQGRRSKSIDSRTKKGLWWIVLVLLSIAGRMVAIWFQ